jgi:uncharacterized membrane protein YkoI
MLHVKAIVMGVSGCLLLSAPAIAAGSMQEAPAPARNSSTVSAFVAMAPKVSLSAAIQDAEKNAEGKLVRIRFTDAYGHAAYEATFVSGDQMVTDHVDPNSGAVGPANSIPIKSGPALRDRFLGNEEAAAKSLKSPTWSLQEAIDTAQQRVPGKAMDARLTEQRGRPVYAIGVVSGEKIHNVNIDPMTGKVAWQYERGGATAAAAQNSSVLGGRVEHALNLLEAQGYRDFTWIRPDGRDFDVGVRRGGKSMTLAVDPDTGRIAAHA